MKIVDQIRRALRGPMYAKIVGSGIEAIIVIDGQVKGVIAVGPSPAAPGSHSTPEEGR